MYEIYWNDLNIKAKRRLKDVDFGDIDLAIQPIISKLDLLEKDISDVEFEKSFIPEDSLTYHKYDIVKHLVTDILCVVATDMPKDAMWMECVCYIKGTLNPNAGIINNIENYTPVGNNRYWRLRVDEVCPIRLNNKVPLTFDEIIELTKTLK